MMMEIFKLVNIIILISFFGCKSKINNGAKIEFDFEKCDQAISVSDFESYKINRNLNRNELICMCSRIRISYKESINKYQQDYLISLNCDLVKELIKHDSSLNSKEVDDSGKVFFEDVKNSADVLYGKLISECYAQ